MLSSSVCVMIMNMCHCSSNPFFSLSFTRVVDTLIPIVLLLGSSSFILKAWFRSRRSFHSALYAPLKQHSVTSYGTTSPSLDDNQQDDQVDNDSPSSSTIASNQSYEVPLKRWSIYNLTRLTGTLLQLGMSAAALRVLLAHEYTLDTAVEGSSSNVFTSSIADCVYWVSMEMDYIQRDEANS